MGILLLAAARGTALTIATDGPDEREALDALCALIHNGLGEDPCSG
jgi:phosphocarrier protein